MSGPVPSPSMKGITGRSGTSRRPSAPRRIGSPGGTVTVEKVGMGVLKQNGAGGGKEPGGGGGRGGGGGGGGAGGGWGGGAGGLGRRRGGGGARRGRCG